MSGFIRGTQPASPRRERIILESIITVLCLEDVSARIEREQVDPFLCDDPCPASAVGHQVIMSCGEAVCWHCGKIFWK